MMCLPGRVSVRLDRSGSECRIGNMRPAISRSVMARLAGGTSADNAVMPIAIVDAERSRPIGSVLDQLRSSGRRSRPMESRVTESAAALVRERVEVATSRFQRPVSTRRVTTSRTRSRDCGSLPPASKSVCRSSDSLPISPNTFKTRSVNASIPNSLLPTSSWSIPFPLRNRGLPSQRLHGSADDTCFGASKAWFTTVKSKL